MGRARKHLPISLRAHVCAKEVPVSDAEVKETVECDVVMRTFRVRVTHTRMDTVCIDAASEEDALDQAAGLRASDLDLGKNHNYTWDVEIEEA